MSCRNYETILTEAARGQMLDARAKLDALAHAETCQRCAARLADEKSLSAGLRSLSADAAVAQTPARVEAALLEAFRGRPAFVPAVAPVRLSKSHWARWAVAAAAAVFVVSALASWRFLPAVARETVKRGASIAQPSQLSLPVPVEDESIADSQGQRLVGDKQDRRVVPVAQLPRSFRDSQRGLVHDAGFSRGRMAGGVGPETAASPDEEIVTDFMPLTYDGSFAQRDDGQLVRVELPRSALHSFGLPVSAERGGGRVKADVLLGHDGVARAIRFVR